MQKKLSDNPKGNRARRQRTIDLLDQSIKRLESRKIDVTVKAIEEMSKKVDPTGRGICYSAFRHNSEAYDTFRKHAKYLKGEVRKRKGDWDKEFNRMRISGNRSAILRRLEKLYRKCELAEGLLKAIEMNTELRARYVELSAKHVDLSAKYMEQL